MDFQGQDGGPGEKLRVRPINDLSDAQIENELGNYERHVAGDKSLTTEQEKRHFALLEASAKRAGFDFDVSLAFLSRIGRNRTFTSYGDLAAANGLEWQQARRPMNHHLWDLVRYSNERWRFMISAILVDKPNVATGIMNSDTLAGFCKAADSLGYRIGDPQGFLKDRQEKTFRHFSTG